MASKDSPYSTGFLSSNINFNTDSEEMFKRIKEEEKVTHQAIAQLPYEFSQLPQYFADMVDNGMRASINIENILKSNNVEHKKELAKLKDNLDKIVRYLILNVDSTLDKFAIRSNVESDEK